MSARLMFRPFQGARSLALGIGVLVGLLVLPPLYSLGENAFRAGFAAAYAIGPGYLGILTLKTVSLGFVTTIWALLLAVPFAWLVVRTDLPGRGLWRWLGALPLAIPSYVGALAYIALLGPSGMANDVLASLTGQVTPWFTIYGYWGGAFVLGLFTYPMIFLLVAGALENTNPALEETARTLGHGLLGIFRCVTLPLLRPMILAGALLVFLYAISDFGALSLLRVQVLTTEIYHHLNTRFDPTTAALLAWLLVVIAIMVLVSQRFFLGRRGFTTVTGSARRASPLRLGRWRWAALGWVLSVLTVSLFLPVGLLLYEMGSAAVFVDVVAAQWMFIVNSLWTGALAAILAVIIGVVVANVSRRLGPWTGKSLTGVVQIGYAIPGTVLGLSLILLYNTYVPWLYGSVAVIIIAYLIRFLTQAVQGQEAALTSIHHHLEEVAQSLGAGPTRVLRRIILPITKPAILAGWALVFISAMKELDATLLLRPAGFDTVPIRIYIHTVEADYAKAAAMSLVLIIVIAIPLFLVTTMREKKII